MPPLLPPVVIRRATPGELSTYVEISRRTFVDTFGHVHPPDEVAAHVAATYNADLLRGDLQGEDRVVLAMCDGDTWLAYALIVLGAATPSVGGARPSELVRFYVDRPWHGSGAADALMAAVMGVAREAGGDALWLGVWEHNPRAIRFYERQGFRIVGSKVYVYAGHHENDHIMARAL